VRRAWDLKRKIFGFASGEAGFAVAIAWQKE